MPANKFFARRVGSNIRLYREAHGLTQHQLAVRCGASSADQVAKWERGLKDPREAGYVKIAQALDVHPDHLMDPPDVAQARARAIAAARAGARLLGTPPDTPPEGSNGSAG